jgi:hypothetical protein
LDKCTDLFGPNHVFFPPKILRYRFLGQVCHASPRLLAHKIHYQLWFLWISPSTRLGSRRGFPCI